MIITLDRESGPAPSWLTLPGALDLLGPAPTEAGQARHLSDLLAAADTGSVYLGDPDTAARVRGYGADPLLYRAYRDVARPRPKRPLRANAPQDVAPGEAAWFADLVVYPGGTVAGGRELARSLGHWNTSAQIEIFQVLSGRVLMLHTDVDNHGRRTVDFHVCGPGDHVVIPFGAWHLTAVLDGPAAVFNIYTDIPVGTTRGHCSRDAATDATLKYRGAPAPQVAVLHRGDGAEIAATPDELATRSIRPGALPGWAAEQLDPAGLAHLFLHGSTDDLNRLQEQAIQHAAAMASARALTARVL